MAEGIAWIGGTLAMGSVMGIVFSLMLYGVLTPTEKSPVRPGDLEGRRSLVQQIKFEGGVFCLGAALLVVGLAIAVM